MRSWMENLPGAGPPVTSHSNCACSVICAHLLLTLARSALRESCCTDVCLRSKAFVLAILNKVNHEAEADGFPAWTGPVSSVWSSNLCVTHEGFLTA
jgi:hypothetical protein